MLYVEAASIVDVSAPLDLLRAALVEKQAETPHPCMQGCARVQRGLFCGR
jgi:hypothetical protein